MAETFPVQVRPASPSGSDLQTTKVSPALVYGLIAVCGAVLFAAAGAALGFYLMLPFDVG